MPLALLSAAVPAVAPAPGLSGEGGRLARPARDLMLVDLDAFYVSVERRRDPALAGRPVVVGGVPGERGVVASASYEARAYGVRAGMPLAQAADLCPKAVFLHGDHAAYEAASAEVMALLRAFAPRVEPVSLDEAFLDVTGCERLHLLSERGGSSSNVPRSSNSYAAACSSGAGECGGLRRGRESRADALRSCLDVSAPPAPRGGESGDGDPKIAVRSLCNLGDFSPAAGGDASASGRGRRSRSWLDAAEALHDEVLARTGLSVSIGIGGTRTVASVAAALAKPAGALEVPRGEEAAFLAALPIEALPGVGPRMREALARFNLHAIGDLARVPQDVLEETFGRVGVSLSRRARGLEDDDGEPVGNGRPGPKSVSRETSFARDTADRALVAATLSYLAQRATAALRRERMLCKSVAVRLRYSDFRTVEARRRLDAPTDRDRDVLEAVESVWPARWDRRVRLRLVGVSLVSLTPAGERQLDLFDGPVRGEGATSAGEGVPAGGGALDAALDRLRSRHGFGAVVRGRAIEGLARMEHDEKGFRLRTPACSA